MRLAGVRKQLEDASVALVESARLAAADDPSEAYRLALRARNAFFHAMRGLAAARGLPLPEMPVVGIPGGSIGDQRAVLAAIERAIGVERDADEMPAALAAARQPLALYLGWLRNAVGRLLSDRGPNVR